jgi:hypothetical protein
MTRRDRKGLVVTAAALLLGACSGGGSPFSNPFGSSAPPPRVEQLPVAANPQAAGAGGRPSVVVNVPPARVQATIMDRAKTRGTMVLGANQTGVTLEIPLRQSSEVVVQQCGPHRDNRTLRVYLETLPNGPGTTVSEDRYVVDGGQSSCQLKLTQADVEDANRSLEDLKRQAEGAPRTASNTTTATPGAPGTSPRSPSSNTPSRRTDPAGGLEPVNPNRPVVPIR